ncbi:outer membrane beta-barrel protein [Spirosoma agri]|uniref:PorT family protein n=1 Tax=Spirosoma agri TaxID=1987381 RepID=A0A6M0IRC3_9BACT|nr:outer membrane beta-barrel protein [Spirosoma agri]NEU70879.1 PorT family protein [Spirosoma agri]
MKTVYCKTLALVISIINVSYAQNPVKESYFGIRAGYLKASTDVNNLTKLPYEIRLGGVAPLNSFYGGVFYHHNVSPWLAYRVELNYQQKGIELQNQNGNVVGHQKLHYAGLTPLIGITPLNGLSLFVGPEANVYLGQSVDGANYGPNTTPIELGISSRLSYRYKWIGLEVGHSQALNDYKSVDIAGARSTLRNRAWQAGLLFAPTLLKKKGK